MDGSIRIRKTLWISSAAGILLTGLLVGLAYAFDASGIVLFEPGRLWSLVAVALSALPALLWVFVFYRLDAAQPEPKRNVASMAILGALIAGALSRPFLGAVGAYEASWLSEAGPWAGFAFAVLAVGAVEEGLKYAGLRLSLYDSPDFDERTDGIVYAGAMGLGFAFSANLSMALAEPGARLGPLASAIAIETISQATASGLWGWFMARAKFDKRPAWWPALGLLLGAALNGTVRGLVVDQGRQGLAYTGIVPLCIAAALSVAVFGALFVFSRRGGGVSVPVKGKQANAPEWIALLCVAAALASGLAVMASARSRTLPFDDGGIAFAYPARWARSLSFEGRESGLGELVFAANAHAVRGSVPQGYELRRVDGAGSGLAMIMTRAAMRDAEDLEGYRAGEGSYVAVAGKEIAMSERWCLEDGAEGSVGGEPALGYGARLFVPRAGGWLLLSAWGDALDREALRQALLDWASSILTTPSILRMPAAPGTQAPEGSGE